MIRLSISQRQCRFTNEANSLSSSPVYSYNICQMECRRNMALQFCGCIPHFYRPNGKKKQKYRVCDFSGLYCLLHIQGIIFRHIRIMTIFKCPLISISIADELISLKSKVFKIKCECLTNCDDSKFYVQSYVSIGNCLLLVDNLMHSIIPSTAI